MRLAMVFVLPLLLTFGVATAADDEEKIEIKKDGDKTEYKIKIKKEDGKYFGKWEGRKYELRGAPMVRVEDEGDYIVHGRIVDDDVIETTEVRPAVRTRVITEEPAYEVRVEPKIEGEIKEKIEIDGDEVKIKREVEIDDD